MITRKKQSGASRLLLFCAIPLFYGTAVLAQANQAVIPPSPKAESFHIYDDIPVSHSTGVQDISIPLYTINSEGVELPIVLKYHIGSLKPLEPNFSEVGWGWTLEYGGRISRTIYDNPDELMDQAKEIRSSDNINENVQENYNYLRQSEQYLLHNLGNDTEYDIFSIASLNTYGRFLINKEAAVWKPYFMERTAGKLALGMVAGNSYTNEIIENISLTNESGIKYVFGNGAIEKTTNSGNYLEYSPLSWLISSIESDYGKELISFEYEDIPMLVYSQGYGQISIQSDNAVRLNDINASPTDQGSTLPLGTEIEVITETAPNAPSIGYYMKTISQINFQGGVIEFDLDVNNRFIESITVKDSGGAQVKRFNFVYGAFNNMPNEYRKLQEVVVLDSQNNELNSYQFEYENEPAGGQFIPLGIDYWGYFRGSRVSTAGDLNPPRVIEYFNWTGNISSAGICSTTTRGDGNRTANSHAYDYALTKIVYPTGGYTEFEYDLNQYDKVLDYCNSQLCEYYTVPLVSGGGFRVKRSTNRNYDGSFISRKRYVYEPGFINLDVTDSENFTTTSFSAKYKLITQTYTDGSGNPITVPLTRQYSRFRNRTLSSSLRGGLSFDGVYFQTITELSEDQNGNNTGKVVYHYEHPNQTTYLPLSQTWTTSGHPLRAFVEASGTCDIFENFTVPYQIRAFGNNHLKKVEYFNKDQTGYFNNSGLMKVEEYEYAVDELHEFDNLRLYTLCTYEGTSPTGGPAGYSTRMDIYNAFPGNADVLPLYIHHNYKIFCGSFYLYSKTVNVYDKDGTALQQVETYSYNDRGLLSTTTSQGSLKEYVTERQYVFDNLTENLPDPNVKTLMLERNIIGVPLNEKTLVNSNVVDGVHRKFNFITNENNQTNTNIVRLSEMSKLDGNVYNPKEMFTRYNSANGLLIEQENHQGMITSYVWAYSNQYPAFKVENAGYDAVVSLLTSAEKTILSGVPTESDIGSIHTKLVQNLPQARVYGYTFKPLVGIAAVLDPNGRKETYSYDTGGRLQFVKDHDGNILKGYKYGYRKEN